MNSSFPWQDDTFDVVTAFNSLFFATDQVSTLSEVRRVTRPSVRVAIVYWGLPEEVKASVYLDALKPLMPPPPEPPNPFSTADQLEELARKAQLKPQRVFDVDWSWKYPDLQTDKYSDYYNQWGRVPESICLLTPVQLLSSFVVGDMRCSTSPRY